MERRLFPWLNQNVTMHTLPKTFRGRGIVIAAGFWQLRSAYVTIKSIREALGSSLPIEIFYNGDEELPEQSADELLKFPFVKLINLATYIDTHVTSSWGVKPFALLFSSFKESIIIDADSMFLRDPEELFSFSGYARTGSLLFRDRTVSGSTVEGKNWIGKILTQPSAYALKHNRIYTGDSIHEGESGVVVMHKGKKANFDALVLTALMNSVAHRNELWQIFYGDKESWWLAHELMHAPYHLANGGGGAIGYTAFENNSTYVCGGLLHVDEAWRPFWFNGGVIANKHFEDGKQVLINYTHWMTDPDYKDVQWIWEEKDKPFCMKERQGREVYGLTEGQMGIAEGLVRAWEGATHIHV
ncbi:mannosyltransferase putative-domain-containing protein [Chytridium lagenaria]|nr:mannosyltransferase putative-domain-containing protein [Chytridium lagenaria]